MKLRNDLLLRTISGEICERPPVWLMRQAGRILPQYRALRGKLSGFKELVETPELACEVTIQPIDELDVDAAIIFSDILVVPEAMGLSYNMVEKTGPVFPETIKSLSDINKLQIIKEGSNLQHTIEAIELTKKELKGRVPLIGFAGAPWTIFCYMIEGKGSKTFSNARKMLYADEKAAHLLLQKITETTIYYLKNQVKAGADVVQLFDSWAGVLNKELYKKFCLPYINQICKELSDVPFTFFAKGAYFSFEDFKELPCETIGLDWTINASEARKKLGNDKVLQGNFDPAQLYASHDEIKQKANSMISAFGKGKHIVNLGHGVYPDTPLDGVKAFVNSIKAFQY